jgi:charged multivesicular body protein 3
MKIAGAMKSSTEVMKSMSNLMKLPELQKTILEMSKEMTKAGIIEEMINDTMDSVLDDDADIDTIADAEVEKIIIDITQGKLKNLTDVNTNPLSSGASSGATAIGADDNLEDEDEDEMTKRLEALRT